jgi:hypothetical protein
MTVTRNFSAMGGEGKEGGREGAAPLTIEGQDTAW